ncbi:unnamed protein product [Fusarium langsethiae]|nr:unnamed protein product [Fusarium langsethiae]GKU10351.1 unnamed protein product [Fusarium langsethiae]
MDGEEAFKYWTDEDSFYRAWNPSPMALQQLIGILSSIGLFVLFGLSGSPNPAILTYFSTTHLVYKIMASLEQHM